MSIYESSFTTNFAKAKELFPYTQWNDQQFQIIQQILALDEGDGLLIQSPTGSGKSVASLTALLSRRTEDQKIFVFTRTVSQMEPILREWGRMYSYETVMNDKAPLIVPLLGKGRTCKQMAVIQKSSLKLDFPMQSVHLLCKSLPCKLHPEHPENDTYNVRAGMHQLKLINAKIAGAAKSRSPPIDGIIEQLNKHRSCGYYSLRSMLTHATIIIATYPYLRNPLLFSTIKHMKTDMAKVMILVDEAHNLVSEKRTVLLKEDILRVERAIGKYELILKMLKAMQSKKRMSANTLASDLEYESIIRTLNEANPEVRKKMKISMQTLADPAVANFISFLQARHSGWISSYSDRLEIVEPTPAAMLSDLDEAALKIYMSGTFYPIVSYKKLFGMEKAKHLVVGNIREHNEFRSFLTWKGMTSKFNRRGPLMYQNMALTILYITKLNPRHVLVVCPSYQFKADLCAGLKSVIMTKYPDRGFEFVEEEKDMDIKKLTNKVVRTNESLILVGVSGGKISEGVEFVYKGNSMLSTVVFAGLPYRPVTDDQQLIQNVLASVAADVRTAKQFQQSIPIMRAVKQAFGRTIRSDDDKGALVILDVRAEELLKAEMGLVHYREPRKLVNDMMAFFSRYPRLVHLIK